MNQNENKMNENLDLTEILKDCPKGTKLYSPLFGDVEFDCISGLSHISVNSYPDNISLYFREIFCKDGRYVSNYGNAECMLFPSKENRDWSTFKVKKKPEKEEPKFKAGDYITDGTSYFLVVNIIKGKYLLCTQKGINSAFTPIAVDNQYHLCNSDEVAMFKKSLHENGFHWSKSQNKLAHWYRPFERVLVRFGKGDNWNATFFSHYDKDNGMFALTTIAFAEEGNILPYEGNEDKLGKITE